MFCSECGKQIADGSKFCPECGKPLALPTEQEPKQDTAPPQAKKALPTEDVQPLEHCCMGAAVACAGAAVIALAMAKNALFFVINGALGALIFVLCYQKLQNKDYETAKSASLGLGVACGVLGMIGIVGNDFTGVVGLGACGALVYVFAKL